MTMKINILKFFLLAVPLAATLLAGCQTGRMTEPKEPGDVVSIPMSQAGIEIEGILKADGTVNMVNGRSQTLPGQPFYIRSIVSSRDDAGVITLQITASSLSSSELSLRYRVVWFNNDGMEIEPGASGWTQVTFAPRESKSLRSVARADNPKTFRAFVQSFDFQR